MHSYEKRAYAGFLPRCEEKKDERKNLHVVFNGLKGLVAMNTDAQTGHIRGWKITDHWRKKKEKKKRKNNNFADTYEPFLSSRLRAIQAFNTCEDLSKPALDILISALQQRSDERVPVTSGRGFQNKAL